MKKEIENFEDVKLLVDSFYGKVRDNNLLGFIFDDVAKVNWETHLPKMYDFWAGILLGERNFTGNPMLKHILLSRRTEMSEIQYAEWLSLFAATVDEHFEGPNAELAIERSKMIARNMLYRIKEAELNQGIQ